MIRVLFIAKGDLPDYQSDMIFHGGRSVLGDNFVDCNKLWYMYKDEKELYWNSRVPDNGKAYGRGFTLCGKFDEDNVDRTDIAEKIKNKYFDKIIYGSCTRCLDYFDIVKEYYDKKDIILVDGEDDQSIRKHLLPFGTYYKRELRTEDLDKAKPLYFAIPEEIIIDNIPNKYRDYATIIPGDLSTYIYDTEQEYYNGYQESYFGVTFKKGGWDCLRHYEIIANGCIPYFPDLSQCPQHTMASFPKKLVIESNIKLQRGQLSDVETVNYINYLLQYAKNNLTTKHLFNYVIKEPLMKSTYIFICNFNRLNPTKKLVESLTSRGYNNIVILDNGSTYPPLLEWYSTLNTDMVYFCKHNYGPEALDRVRDLEPEFQEKYNHIVLNEYHVYTDGDVIPIDEVPENFIDDMIELAIKYSIPKLGLSLKIDDLPDHFELKERVYNHEKSFFEREYIDDEKCRLYKAPVDTTFAVNSPGMQCGYSDYAYRAAGNYFARHSPWYYDTNNLPDDEVYYLQHIEGPRPHWSNILKSIISEKNVNSNS
jgi:hypothetical protein